MLSIKEAMQVVYSKVKDKVIVRAVEYETCFTFVLEDKNLVYDRTSFKDNLTVLVRKNDGISKKFSIQDIPIREYLKGKEINLEELK